MNAAGGPLAAAFRNACLAEIEALKPGNVHIFADGHGMVVQDFLRSAEAAALPIAQSGASVGLRIRQAVDATWQAVGCNTNLGIVLLCAPLLRAMEQPAPAGLRARLRETLRELTVDDAREAYQAILRASPAGLGESDAHDVHAPPQVTLLEAMRAAAPRDMIARQYAGDYADVFEVGMPAWREASGRWQRPAWATSAAFLAFLAHFPDTHVARKHGAATAQALQAEAARHYDIFRAQDNPKHYQPELLRFDADLKKRGLNPGTSADLTVASVLACRLEDMLAAA